MSAPNRQSKQALLVVGMHRSGTSALTRVLDLHGVSLGSELSGAAADNETGFWENRRVVDFHERLLDLLGSSWDDPRELHPDWLGMAVSAGYLDELVELLDSEFDGCSIWAVKDPRMCRVLQLWRMALDRLHIEPKLIFSLRDPGEVIGSLKQRNGLSAAAGALLWLRHLAEPVQASSDLPRCVIDYPELLKDWCGCIGRTASSLEIAWPVPSSECAARVDAHLRSDLKHQQATETRELLPSAWRELLLGVYAKAQAVALDSGDWGAFALALREALEFFAFARPLIADLQPASIEAQFRGRLAEAELARLAYQAEAERLFGENVAGQQQVMEIESKRKEVERSWQAEIEARLIAERQALSSAAEAEKAQADRQADKEARQAAEQRALSQSEESSRSLVKWQAEKEARLVAERLAQSKAEEAGKAQASWLAEKEARQQAEQRAKEKSEEADRVQVDWQAEKKARLVAEQQAMKQGEEANRALTAWLAEKEARLAAERQALSKAADADKAQADWLAEKEARLVAEHQAKMHREEANAASIKLQKERGIRMKMENEILAFGTEIRKALEIVQAQSEARAAAEQALSLARTRLVEVQGEVVRCNARITMLEQLRAELDMIKASRSWRWTRPLRFVMRTLRYRGVSPEDRRRLGWSVRPAAAVVSSGMPTLAQSSAVVEGHAPAAVIPAISEQLLGAVVHGAKLAPQAPHQRDFFLWAVIDWHFRIQRPQHLARELAAAGHRVFYVSNNFIDRVEPGFSVEALDDEGRLFQVHLHLAGSPAIYHAAPDAAQREQLRAGIGLLLAWTRSHACASLVQHPYWLETAQVLPNQRLVYDCMDHHGGFADNTEGVLAREHELMRIADLLVVTSDWLRDEAGRHNTQCLMVRNACQYEHFCKPPAEVFNDPHGRRVIGYYGAIAEWFDLDLLEKVAQTHPDCLVLLVGADTTGAQQRLRHLTNVQFTGEVPYVNLPYYLYGFNVCLLPFQVIPLTLATNPVKVYEYLSAGKDVVSIDLPELRQFGELVRTGDGHDAFLAALDDTLRRPTDELLVARRRRFAAEQTWAHRVQDLSRGIEVLPLPKVSVIVVTYNNLDLTKACLDSIDRMSDYPNLEVIVVDNASADETPVYLQAWAEASNNRRIILNEDNRGFAAANNQGLATATGDYLVMLNNDTYVTPGWIATLARHMRRTETLGVLGPVTNNIGNEARIDIHYANMEEMLQVAGGYTARHAGQLTPLHTAAFFCVMMPRRVYEKVGELDEAFGIGMFEDDDYCRRVQEAGWTIACADDVFIHHHLSASFNKIKQEKRQAMFEQNKAIYEAKWGAWVPHKYRGQ